MAVEIPRALTSLTPLLNKDWCHNQKLDLKLQVNKNSDDWFLINLRYKRSWKIL